VSYEDVVGVICENSKVSERRLFRLDLAGLTFRQLV